MPLLGQLLIQRDLIKPEDVERAVEVQRTIGGRIGAILVRIGALSEDGLLETLCEQLQFPVIGKGATLPDDLDIYNEIQSSEINFEWFIDQSVVIWPLGENQLACLAKDPLDNSVRETLRFFYPNANFQYFLSRRQDLDRILGFLSRERAVESLFHGGNSKHLKELAEEAPVVELVSNIISQAVEAEASDIHIEPQEMQFNVRFRVDGVLRRWMSQPADRFAAVASRIKLISGIDIAERRLPQDGRLSTRVNGKEMDIRVSTAPEVHGESIVMRLLPKEREKLALGNLGMEPDHLKLMEQWSHISNGVVLVTGPTGSGKSTTLYSMLDSANTGDRKMITVEDPVEFQLQGVTQIQAHADIGYTFARALRAILRQDPDVIMIGEIRDKETAEIAIQSALTGHLVLSTLHTNDAVSAFPRLIDMGIEPFLVAAPIKGVQAQRLVRRVCEACAESVERSPLIAGHLDNVAPNLVGALWKQAKGCDKCQHTGYKGRVGVYELIPTCEVMQNMIVAGATLNELKTFTAKKGYRSLYQDGLIKASRGITTVDEVLRVVASDV